MDWSAMRAVANAVLYEGYMLYPYRPSALKNRSQGWSFGTLLPASYAQSHAGEPSGFHAEVLVLESGAANIGAEFRFLHLADAASKADAIEREVEVGPVKMGDLLSGPITANFSFPERSATREPPSIAITGTATISAERVRNGVVKLRLALANVSVSTGEKTRDEALRQALVSAHALLAVEGGEFVSLLDPPDQLRAAASSCKQEGVFPVLAGTEGKRAAMLVSPIILYDYPRIAESSHGDFFDSSEIDEMLTLRVLTLSDEEKREISEAGGRAQAILGRTESLSAEEILKLHGVTRGAEKGSDG